MALCDEVLQRIDAKAQRRKDAMYFGKDFELISSWRQSVLALMLEVFQREDPRKVPPHSAFRRNEMDQKIPQGPRVRFRIYVFPPTAGLHFGERLQDKGFVPFQPFMKFLHRLRCHGSPFQRWMDVNRKKTLPGDSFRRRTTTRGFPWKAVGGFATVRAAKGMRRVLTQ
jgi:hypothetical protein